MVLLILMMLVVGLGLLTRVGRSGTLVSNWACMVRLRLTRGSRRSVGETGRLIRALMLGYMLLILLNMLLLWLLL